MKLIVKTMKQRPQEPGDRWKRYGRNLRQTVSMSTVGLEMALSVGVGYFIGDWLDGWLDTQPYLMITFVVIGSIAGFLSLYRKLKRLNSEQND